MAFGPCIWVERQWLVSQNIGRPEGEWVTRDGKHHVEVRRVWGNTFELASKTGWIDGPVRAKGNSPGCGPMLVTCGRVSLLTSSTKPQTR